MAFGDCAGAVAAEYVNLPEPIVDDLVLAAIREAAESRAVEFKESQPFTVLRWKLVKTSMAMANLREGGIIVVGISERSSLMQLAGMDTAHLQTYNQDELLELVNRYATPPLSLTLRVVTYNNQQFIGIKVAPFDRSPIFCGRATPSEAGGDSLRIGDVVARTRDRISTSRTVDVTLMAEILEIAAEKRAAEIVRTAQSIGFVIPEGDRERFAQEKRDFSNDFE